ncbi:hypothetical protein BDD12DRAFT_432417 [Trichophaea hybrida]|nr:hypothetical protein BDD12DRAFT_432417 [Trichophaea hybrida]
MRCQRGPAARINIETEKPAKSKVSTQKQSRKQNARKLTSYTLSYELIAHSYDTANLPLSPPTTQFGCSAIGGIVPPSRGVDSVFQSVQCSASYRSVNQDWLFQTFVLAHIPILHTHILIFCLSVRRTFLSEQNQKGAMRYPDHSISPIQSA